MPLRFFLKNRNPNKGDLAVKIKEYNKTREHNCRQYFCHIPFTQLYISFGGNIYACCGNRHYLLGKYPEQSLHDIWFGKRVQKLREALAEGDLGLGCDVCREQLMNGNYDLVLARQYDQYAPYASEYPVSFEFELSNTCNLDCIMCYEEFSTTVARRLNPDYSQPFSPYDDEFIRQFEEFIPHLKEISFKGGEPFLIKVYMDIWQKIIDLNPPVMIRIITNTTAFNDRIKQMLLRSNFYLNVSIDSLIPERYEKIRRNASFGKTMENIMQMLDLNRQKGLSHMTVMVCLMTVNWEEMPSFVRFCNENDVAIMFLYITFPALYLSVKNAGPKKQRLIYQTLSAISVDDGSAYSRHNSSVYRQLLAQLSTWLEHTEKRSLKEQISVSRESLKYFFETETFFHLNIAEKKEKTSEYLVRFDELIRTGDHDTGSGIVEMDTGILAALLTGPDADNDIRKSIDEHYRGLTSKL